MKNVWHFSKKKKKCCLSALQQTHGHTDRDSLTSLADWFWVYVYWRNCIRGVVKDLQSWVKSWVEYREVVKKNEVCKFKFSVDRRGQLIYKILILFVKWEYTNLINMYIWTSYVRGCILLIRITNSFTFSVTFFICLSVEFGIKVPLFADTV